MTKLRFHGTHSGPLTPGSSKIDHDSEVHQLGSPCTPLCGQETPGTPARLLCGNDMSRLSWFDSADEELARKMWAGLRAAGFWDAFLVFRFQVTSQLLDRLLLPASLMGKER